MFKDKKIEYLKNEQSLFGNSLFIKYQGEEKQFLTNGKVDLEDFKLKQAKFYNKARKETIEKAKNWKQRYENYLRLWNN